MGRIRLHIALDCSAYSLETFILDNVEPGSTIATDSWKSYNFIDNVLCTHERTNQSKTRESPFLIFYHSQCLTKYIGVTVSVKPMW